jgi:hypothetical protein
LFFFSGRSLQRARRDLLRAPDTGATRSAVANSDAKVRRRKSLIVIVSSEVLGAFSPGGLLIVNRKSFHVMHFVTFRAISRNSPAKSLAQLVRDAKPVS